MEAACIGFSGSGVSAIFDAISGPGGGATGLSGGRGRLATISVPDPRIDKLTAIFNPKKTVYAGVRLRDIPGLPHGGGNTASQMASAREVDCLVAVLGCFTADDPGAAAAADREKIQSELHLSDLALLETRLDRKKKASSKPTPTQKQDKAEAEALEPIVAAMSDGTALREIAVDAAMEAIFEEQGLASYKPVLWVENCAEEHLAGAPEGVFRVCATLEQEVGELDAAERAEMLSAYGVTELAGPRLLRAIYDALGLISFFTVGPDEVRAWTLRAGQTAVDAAGAIHTDLARGFVRAKVYAHPHRGQGVRRAGRRLHRDPAQRVSRPR
ncbi:MAG: DUF933 domain-containing protein [Planctomycetota bacterium]|jgi:ribosome-binding ATPase YchF (GTP1/OBG family)